MANRFLVKRSAVTTNIPTTGQLELGEIAINTFDGKLFIKKDNGTASIVEVGSGSTAYTESTFTATASQTTFAVGVAMTLVNVFLNGLRLLPTTDYSISGTNIVLTTGAALDDILSVLRYSNSTSGGTVTNVGFTGGLISVATASTTPALTVAGTSGGIPYFSSATTWASSAALAASSLVIGGGAGVAPSTITTGTGVVTALGVAVGNAGAFVVSGGALGTPSSGIVTNLTGTASISINGTVGATTPNTIAGTTGVFGSTTSLLLGTAGSAVGNIGFRNATSGTATLAPPTGALGTYTITLPNVASVLPIFGQQITFAGPTIARTITLPDAAFTVARTDAANTFTGIQTMTSPAFTTPVLGTPTSGNISNCTSTSMVLVTPVLGTPTSGNISNCTSTSMVLVTPVLGTPTSGNLSNCTADGTNAVGYLTVPQNSQSAAYTAVLADNGKHIFHPVGDANARTFTIPANASVAFPIGSALTFVNMSASAVTIAITTDVMNLAGAGTTGSRTLANYGVATALKVTATNWIISGTNLT